jgi:hypothetical protein
MRVDVVAPPIRSREIVGTERSSVRHREDAVKPLEFRIGVGTPCAFLTLLRGGGGRQ